MKRLLTILILATAALGVAACNNGSGSGSTTAPTVGSSAEPTMSVESPAASDMPAASEEASSTP